MKQSRGYMVRGVVLYSKVYFGYGMPSKVIRCGNALF